MITLTNDFHSTSVRLRSKIGDTLSDSQIKRAALALCPFKDCICGRTSANVRGRQDGFIVEQLGSEIIIAKIDEYDEITSLIGNNYQSAIISSTATVP